MQRLADSSSPIAAARPRGGAPAARIARWAMRTVSLLSAALSLGFVQQGGEGSGEARQGAVPPARQADRVAIITVDGVIDQWSERSIKRRIEQAEASGADAIAFDIDSPGGEVGAVLEITNAIKSSSIANTVAWINPDAYSGGAIVALACREIVANSPASMGDAFPVLPTGTGLRGLSADERTKILPVLLGDVTDSARRNGYDEFLVQAIVIDGIELWMVTEKETGEKLFINEAEYRILFEGDPPRGKPLLASVPGARGDRSTQAAPAAAPEGETEQSPEAAPAEGTGTPDGEDTTDADQPDEADADLAEDTAGEAAQGDATAEQESTPEEAAEAGEADDGTGFIPATPAVSDVRSETSKEITVASDRPTITAQDRGKYVDPVYVTDGTAPIVMREDQLRRFGFASAIVRNDAELQAFFGAKDMRRSEATWSEGMVRFLTSMPVRGLLIVVFLLGLFLEMTSPGLVLPGTVAIGALALLIAPPMLIGLAGWWEILAILGGLAFLGMELLILPGFGVFGVLGVLALFAGLIGTFIPDGSGGLFGNDADAQGRALGGIATIVLATATAGVGMFFISRHMGSVPILGRLMLSDEGLTGREDREEESIFGALAAERGGPVAGDEGVVVSPLRPSGRVKTGDRIVDAQADRGFVEAGKPVRLIRESYGTWVVRLVREGERPAPPGGEQSGGSTA